jgi:hypothetical protein
VIARLLKTVPSRITIAANTIWTRIHGYDNAYLVYGEVSMIIPFATSGIRCDAKEKWVPEEAIDNFIKNYEEPDSGSLPRMFDEIKEEYWN